MASRKKDKIQPSESVTLDQANASQLSQLELTQKEHTYEAPILLPYEAPLSGRSSSAASEMSQLRIKRTADPFSSKGKIKKKKAVFGFFGHDPFSAKEITQKQYDEARLLEGDLEYKIKRSKENTSEKYHIRTQNIFNEDRVAMAPRPMEDDPKQFMDRIDIHMDIKNPEDLKK